ncbi:pseudouridine synthase [Gordonia sp. TBRC 11910]|uniref:RNA pseudouridylate synthase n=1 Tax=Gordonia asplenii TaxID=2725283 RepID=A0A848L2Q8_9ACTN|nr:pseudouridine synthase [Gordonia asplenii]NMO05124.1 pseudouridine synthase [Gordonia asplenii]
MARRRKPSPLSPRLGVDATRVVLRFDAETTLGHAVLSTPAADGLTLDDLAARADAGELVDVDGRRVDPGEPSTANRAIYFYRDLPHEVEIPFDLEILHSDADLIVVDKPHFLATMPRGRHVTQTALVRLRRHFGNDEIAPAHRLDRLTAGVLLFTVRPQVRAAYQELFAARSARKTYLARAHADEALRTPRRVENRIRKDAGDLRARVESGPVNAISDVELIGDAGGDGLYRLTPHTGRTHQLRLHMAGLGLPIVGDPLYPDVRQELAELPDRGDFTQPLRLLAATLEFDDPLTGVPRRFESRRGLE